MGKHPLIDRLPGPWRRFARGARAWWHRGWRNYRAPLLLYGGLGALFLGGMFAVLFAKDLNDAADVGTLVGGFAGAFAIILVAIQIALQRKDIRLQSKQLDAQRQELSLQRSELEMTRYEIREQSRHLGEQARIMRDQLETTASEIKYRYAQLVDVEWRLGENAELYLKNHGETAANLSQLLVSEKAKGRREPEELVRDREGLQKILGERLAPFGSKANMSGPAFTPGFTVLSHKQYSALVLEPLEGREQFDALLESLANLELQMVFASPFGGGAYQTVKIPFAYLKENWVLPP